MQFELLQCVYIYFKSHLSENISLFVISSGIEPESRASETLILSIVLRDQDCKSNQQDQTLFFKGSKVSSKDFYCNGQQYDTEKFSHCDQPRFTQNSFEPAKQMQCYIHKNEVDEDSD